MIIQRVIYELHYPARNISFNNIQSEIEKLQDEGIEIEDMLICLTESQACRINKSIPVLGNENIPLQAIFGVKVVVNN